MQRDSKSMHHSLVIWSHCRYYIHLWSQESLSHISWMNAPDRYERFVVPDDLEKYFADLYLYTLFHPTPFPEHFWLFHACRIRFDKDPRVLNAGTFTVQREDHTLGNLVRVYFSHKGFTALLPPIVVSAKLICNNTMVSVFCAWQEAFGGQRCFLCWVQNTPPSGVSNAL